jgi:hypothetical protein
MENVIPIYHMNLWNKIGDSLNLYRKSEFLFRFEGAAVGHCEYRQVSATCTFGQLRRPEVMEDFGLCPVPALIKWLMDEEYGCQFAISLEVHDMEIEFFLSNRCLWAPR